jgi:hypothetical protein
VQYGQQQYGQQQYGQQQYGHAPYAQGPPPSPRPAASTRSLTAAKWTTAGIMALLIPLVILSIGHLQGNIAGLKRLGARVAGENSGDGQGLKGGAEAIAGLEVLIVVQWFTLGAVVLLAVLAFVAGAGQAWARIVLTVLVAFPVFVVVQNVVEGGSDALWGLVFLVPFAVLLWMWWLPTTTRGMRAKRG